MLDQLAEYTIPILHPVIVHFPVALSWVALVCASIWLFRDKQVWLRNTIYLECAAVIGAFFAVRTGEAMKEQSEGVPMVDQFVEYHESMGERSMWLLLVTIGVLLAGQWYTGRDMNRAGSAVPIRIVGFLFVLAVALLIGVTSHSGGIMVWGIPV